MDNDSLASSIREIPFRILCEEHNLMEDKFLLALRKSMVGRYFLYNDCEEMFAPIARMVYDKMRAFIKEYFNQKRLDALKMAREARKLPKDPAELYVWLTTSGENYDAGIARKILEDVSPTTLKAEFMRYHDTSDFLYSENVEFFHHGFGNLYTTTIDVCLETFFSVDSLLETFLKELQMIVNNFKPY